MHVNQCRTEIHLIFNFIIDVDEQKRKDFHEPLCQREGNYRLKTLIKLIFFRLSREHLFASEENVKRFGVVIK